MMLEPAKNAKKPCTACAGVLERGRVDDYSKKERAAFAALS